MEDLALVANSPSHLQALIDALSDFCASAGLEISATKTQVMQFLPLVCNQPLPNILSLLAPKQLPRYLSSTPITNISASLFVTEVIPRTTCQLQGTTWQAHMQILIAPAILWLGVWQACSTAVAILYVDCDHLSHVCRELWGVHPRSAAQRRMTAQ